MASVVSFGLIFLLTSPAVWYPFSLSVISTSGLFCPIVVFCFCVFRSLLVAEIFSLLVVGSLFFFYLQGFFEPLLSFTLFSVFHELPSLCPRTKLGRFRVVNLRMQVDKVFDHLQLWAFVSKVNLRMNDDLCTSILAISY